jgi:hypothetical protein
MAESFSERAPRVFFLLHGSTAIPERGKPAQPGSLRFAREYFSFPFVQALMGGPARLHTASGEALRAGNWESSALGDRVANQVLTARPGATDRTLVLIPYDGSKHLISQVREVLAELQKATAALNLPEAAYGFLAHSMGGLVLRTLLTAPAASIDGERLSGSERQDAGRIAARTLYLITLATPHEGSPVADLSTEIRDVVKKIPTNLVGLGRIDLSALTNGLIGNANQYQLKTALWRTLNQGPLAPENLARPDGSLIPLYALSGRTPGGPYFTSPTRWPLGNFPITKMTKEDGQALGMMTVDWALHAIQQSKNTWAKIPEGAREMDTTARYARLKGGLETSGPGVLPKIDGFFPELAYPVFYVRHASKGLVTSDGGADADGLVPIPSGLGMTLGGDTLMPLKHSLPVRIGRRRVPGSWHRLISGPWDRASHVTIYRNADVGEWLFENVLKDAGPFSALSGVSRWTE